MYSLKECDFHPGLKELSDKVPRNMSSQSEIVKHNEQGTMSESQLETNNCRQTCCDNRKKKYQKQNFKKKKKTV